MYASKYSFNEHKQIHLDVAEILPQFFQMHRGIYMKKKREKNL